MTETELANLETELDTTLRLIDNWVAIIEDPNIPEPERVNAEHYLKRLNTLASHQRTELAELKRRLRQQPAPAVGPGEAPHGN